jgi:hypothetical protein
MVAEASNSLSSQQMSAPITPRQSMDSRVGYNYEFEDDGEEVQSELMPYYEDEEEEDYYIEVNDDAYWDVYFDPTAPDTLNTSFSD